MQTENSIFSEIKNRYLQGSMTVKLIFINIAVFVLISFLEVLGRIAGWNAYSFIDFLFACPTNIGNFVKQPWGLITSIFAHYSFWHLVFNLLMLYGASLIFERFFSSKRLLYTYLLGGIFGCLMEMFAHLFLFNSYPALIGASGSVMAILVAIGFYQPHLRVSIWGLFTVRIVWVALILILINLYNAGIGTANGTAYFAHLGGAFLGLVSIKNPFSSSNIISRTIQIGDKTNRFFTKITTKKKKLYWNKKPTYKPTNTRFKTDEEYNQDAKIRQEQIDIILDKISHSGYESLTKKEKELLFRKSQE